jgi:hypothetical protein
VTLEEPFTLVLAAVVGVLSIARMTRFVVDDDHPWWVPVRGWYIRTAPPAWAELITCAFCTSPYFALPVGLWAWLSDLHWSWWLVNGWLAAAYVASMVTVRDLPR